MSTGVVCINLCSANITMDIYRDCINPKASEKSLKYMGMLTSLLIGIIGAVLAWWKYNVISLLMIAFTFQSSSLFFPTVLGMLWRKPTAKASFYSMLISLIVVILWLVGNNAGWGSIFTIDAVWPGLLSSALVYVVMGLLSKPTEDELAQADLFCKAE